MRSLEFVYILFKRFLHRCFYKFQKQRMRIKRAGFEFGVELGADKKRVYSFRQFGDFHQPFIGRLAGENNPLFFQLFYKIRIDFVAVAMPFGNFVFAVS